MILSHIITKVETQQKHLPNVNIWQHRFVYAKFRFDLLQIKQETQADIQIHLCYLNTYIIYSKSA